jgi:hypothetical protein
VLWNFKMNSYILNVVSLQFQNIIDEIVQPNALGMVPAHCCVLWLGDKHVRRPPEMDEMDLSIPDLIARCLPHMNVWDHRVLFCALWKDEGFATTVAEDEATVKLNSTKQC